MVHDGGPRLTVHQPELVWVRVTGSDGSVFTGEVLNEPWQLETVRRGSSIKFVVPYGGPHLLMVTDKYLEERGDWIVHPFCECGLTELFDAPSDLIRATFPQVAELQGYDQDRFTARCGACGGTQVVEHRDAEGGWEGDTDEVQPGQKKDRRGVGGFLRRLWRRPGL